MFRLFISPIVVSLIALGAVYLWGGVAALVLAAMLAVLEVTLSFDNAVVNAKVLEKMSPRWQQRFLTWGMLLSVVGTRLLLPILIVSVVTFVSPWAVAYLAAYDQPAYAALLVGAGPAIKAFGGTFLLLVALAFFFDDSKEVHWLAPIERRLAKWGKFELIEIALVLAALVAASCVAPNAATTIVFAGLVGIILFLLMEYLTNGVGGVATSTARAGLSLFLYLNLLDSAFSLDGVVGAFALTTSLPIIVVGLGIGAHFVRSLTLYLVKQGTLAELRYIEHGAHWAIFGLACTMFVGLATPVPEWVSGTVGLACIVLAYISSRQHLRSSKRAAARG